MAKVLSQITGGKTGYLKVNNSGRAFGTDKLKEDNEGARLRSPFSGETEVGG